MSAQMINRLTITTGLLDHMVLQRTTAKNAVVTISGRSPFAGRLSATIRMAKGNGKSKGKGKLLNAGRIPSGQFRISLGPIGVGGPYDITFTLEGPGALSATALVSDVLVGDVWILGGQSNMQGCGLLTKDFVPHPAIRAFFMDDCWAPAKDPFHNLWQAVDPVHESINGGPWDRGNPLFGAGPGPAFGQEMFRLTGIPQGLIACAHGGTTMDQWSSKLNGSEGRSLYGAMLRRVRKNGGSVAGLLWYQGESDADPVNAPLYAGKMKAFIQALRRDLKSPRLPVAMVQLGRFTGCQDTHQAEWNSIQHQQLLLTVQIPKLTVVPSVDLTLDDPIHISGRDQNLLGERLAKSMHALQKGLKSALSPKISRVEIRPHPHLEGKGSVVLTLENTGGDLGSDGTRPIGFSVRSPEGRELLHDILLNGRTVSLLTDTPAALLHDATVQYGFGANPVCNLRDGFARPLPVFGPIRLGRQRQLGEYLRHWKLDHHDTEFTALGMKHPPRGGRSLGDFQSTGTFSDIRERIVSLPRGTFVFRGTFVVERPQRLAALLGYDGPVAAWLGEKLVYQDSTGRTPAWYDQGRSRAFEVQPGRHTITVALGADQGKAWGIYLRLELLGKRLEGNLPPKWKSPGA